jgi:hypothetical protein
MTRSRLPFAGALVAAAALVLAAAAAPSRAVRHLGQQTGTPELFVLPFDSRLGSTNADNGIELVFPSNQPAAAKAVVYVPGGYGLDLSVPAGTTIGATNAASTTSAGSTPLRGNVVVDSPARFTTDPAAVACAGAAQHAAVWILQLASGATTVPVPVFVDPATGTETGQGLYKLQACFGAPDVPQSAGGAPFGARITDLFVELTRGVTNPATLDGFVWRAFVTPFVPGTTTQNPVGTVEVRSIVPLPQVLTLNGRHDRKTKSIVLTGTLTLAGVKVPGADVDVFGSTKAAVSTFKRLGRVKTKTKTGAYSFRRKATQTMHFGAVVGEYSTSARCDTGASIAPAGCIQENLSLVAYSRLVTVKVPKQKK